MWWALLLLGAVFAYEPPVDASHLFDEAGVLTVECEAPSGVRMGGLSDFIFYRRDREIGRAWAECWDNNEKEIEVLLSTSPDRIVMHTTLYLGEKGHEDVTKCKSVMRSNDGRFEKSRQECWAPVTETVPFGGDCVRATYEHIESIPQE